MKTWQPSPELQRMYDIAATATVWEGDEIPAEWGDGRMTLAASIGHGGYSLYQDPEGRWFRVNTEPLS